MNRLTSSDKRATVLSVRALLSRILFVAFGPFLGWLADVYTLQQAFLASALLFGVLGLFALLMLFAAGEGVDSI